MNNTFTKWVNYENWNRMNLILKYQFEIDSFDFTRFARTWITRFENGWFSIMERQYESVLIMGYGGN